MPRNPPCCPTRPWVSLGLALVLLAAAGTVGSPAPVCAEDAPAPTPGTKALDQRFAGTIVGLKGKVVSIRYDFSHKDQMKDWSESVPFPIVAVPQQRVEWFDDKVRIEGSTGTRHVAEWTGDISVSCTFIPDTDKDAGAYLVPASETDDFATFTLMETYFHKWNGKDGGVHGIIKFGKQWREAGSTSDFIGFRYVDERPPTTPLTPGRPVPATFALTGGKFIFTLPDFELKGGDRGVKLKTFRPGFYVINGKLFVDDVVITGRLSDAWLAKEKVELRTLKPILAAGADGLDAETQAAIERFGADGSGADLLVRVVGDSKRPAAARAAAAQALATGPKKTVRVVIDLLYSPDLEARTHGIAIVKAHLGKDYGFNPKGSEESRSGAIQKLNKDLADNPALLGG